MLPISFGRNKNLDAYIGDMLAEIESPPNNTEIAHRD